MTRKNLKRLESFLERVFQGVTELRYEVFRSVDPVMDSVELYSGKDYRGRVSLTSKNLILTVGAREQMFPTTLDDLVEQQFRAKIQEIGDKD